MNGSQVSLFDSERPLRITKPVRLIELFAGIGAQAKSLEILGVPFEHYRACEIDRFAMEAYNRIHGTCFETSDITQITGKDLGIVDKDKYTYILTYSFPCQSLSNAGKMEGMVEGSGTESALLWEVKRLLEETEELPDILLMENVPAVISERNAEQFNAWYKFLEDKGYTNKYDLLNMKHYGVPQNRQRCFMLSWLSNNATGGGYGEYDYYDFPTRIRLNRRCKDLLETETDVEEKYFLTPEQIEKLESQIEQE